jgi:hypothetical protein
VLCHRPHRPRGCPARRPLGVHRRHVHAPGVEVRPIRRHDRRPPTSARSTSTTSRCPSPIASANCNDSLQPDHAADGARARRDRPARLEPPAVPRRRRARATRRTGRPVLHLRQEFAALEAGYRIGRLMVLREVLGQAPPGLLRSHQDVVHRVRAARRRVLRCRSPARKRCCGAGSRATSVTRPGTRSWVGPPRSSATSAAERVLGTAPLTGPAATPVRGDSDDRRVALPDLPAVRGDLRSRADHARRRRWSRESVATGTTCSRRGSSARRDPRSSSSTATPTASALRSSSATASSSRPRGTRRSTRSPTGSVASGPTVTVTPLRCTWATPTPTRWPARCSVASS